MRLRNLRWKFATTTAIDMNEEGFVNDCAKK
jgi:hypothetical protein